MPGQDQAVRELVAKAAGVAIPLPGLQRQAAHIVPALAGIVTDHFPLAAIVGLGPGLPVGPRLTLKRQGLDQIRHGLLFGVVVPEGLEQSGRNRFVFDIGQQGQFGVDQASPLFGGPALKGGPSVGVALNTAGPQRLRHVLAGDGMVTDQKGLKGRDLGRCQAILIAQVFDQTAGFAGLEFDLVGQHHP